ncbi:MAG: hypothetical protein ACYC7D_09260 [Nitrososphaerales archaeon]
MLDIFPDSEDDSKALAYMDGSDASIFRSLARRLGSEERVQNAFILVGLISELEAKGSSENSLKAERAKHFFPQYAGITFEKFESLIKET